MVNIIFCIGVKYNFWNINSSLVKGNEFVNMYYKYK